MIREHTANLRAGLVDRTLCTALDPLEMDTIPDGILSGKRRLGERRRRDLRVVGAPMLHGTTPPAEPVTVSDALKGGHHWEWCVVHQGPHSR